VRIPTDVLTVLDHAETTGNELRLTGQIDRNLYVLTNKTLEAAGGKWNKKAKAHLFTNPAADVLDAILSTGEVTSPRDFGYFPTPGNVGSWSPRPGAAPSPDRSLPSAAMSTASNCSARTPWRSATPTSAGT
jgi:hypothetical protein